MQFKENIVKLTVDELSGVTNDEAFCDDKNTLVTLSIEAFQDLTLMRNFIYSIRTPEIKKEEISDWQKWDEYICQLDFDEVRKKVKIISESDFVPYQDNNHDEFYHVLETILEAKKQNTEKQE